MNKELRTLAQSLAAELSAADFPRLWRLHSRRVEWYADLYTDDAWLMLEIDRDRLIIKTTRPPRMKHSGQGHTITVNKDRTPEAIARDIYNRIIPEAREYFNQCREAARKDKTNRQTHKATLHNLRHWRRWTNTNSDEQRSTFYSQRSQIDLCTDHAYTMKIDSPTMEEITKILQILEG